MTNRAMSWIKRGSAAFAVGLAIYVTGAWLAGKPPAKAVFLPESHKSPVQQAPALQPFTVERKGHRYEIEPVYAYELRGLVVTSHDSDSIFNISHAKWKDFLNTNDICVVWGENLDTGLLSAIKFWSGNWTCYFQTNSSEAYRQFRQDKISNNHVLPKDESTAKILRNMKVGDEIRIRGHLVNYSIDGGPQRKSSVVRDDRGNGACEVLYVEEAEIVTRHNKRWIRMRQAGQGFSAAGAIILAFGFFVLPFLKRP